MNDQRIEMTVRIEKPPAEVFSAWASADALALWFAPMAEVQPTVTMDFRTGGAYTIVMPLPDGSVHTTSGMFREIVPGRKIVMSWRCDAFPDAESIVRVQFQPAHGGTNLHLVHEQFENTDTCRAHRDGWEACLGELMRQLETARGDLAQLITEDKS